MVGDIGIFFQENGILGDFGSDVVFRIFGIFDTIGKIGVKGAFGGSFGIAIFAVGSGVVRGSVMRGGGIRSDGVMRRSVGRSGRENDGGQRHHDSGKEFGDHNFN